jgi:hypothetical protein
MVASRLTWALWHKHRKFDMCTLETHAVEDAATQSLAQLELHLRISAPEAEERRLLREDA